MTPAWYLKILKSGGHWKEKNKFMKTGIPLNMLKAHWWKNLTIVEL